MDPDRFSTNFEELGEESYEKMSTALSEHFDRLGETSKTNSFNCEAFAKHVSSGKSRDSEAVRLRKALEEISVLYDWDSPNLHSPVKLKSGKSNSMNAIFAVTKFPSSNEECNSFFRRQRPRPMQPNEIFQELFGKTSGKSFLNLLRGEMCVHLNLIDTSSIYKESPLDSDFSEKLSKALRNLKTAKIPQNDAYSFPQTGPKTFNGTSVNIINADV